MVTALIFLQAHLKQQLLLLLPSDQHNREDSSCSRPPAVQSVTGCSHSRYAVEKAVIMTFECAVPEVMAAQA
jgi:hypothetical protein